MLSFSTSKCYEFHNTNEKMDSNDDLTSPSFFILISGQTFETFETCSAVDKAEGDDDSDSQEFHAVLSTPN